MEGKFGGINRRCRVTQAQKRSKLECLFTEILLEFAAKHQFVMQDFCSRFSYLLEKVV